MAAPVLNIGIIGCGTIAPTHAGALRQVADVCLLSVADSIPARADALAKQFDVPRVFSDHTALIADPDIDLVIVCTPSGTHAAIAIDALNAGKHVLIEKPMDVSVAACDRLIAAAERTGRQLGVISQHRFDKATQVAKEAIASGRLGRITLVEASVKWWRTQAYYDSGDWRGTWELDGGGALMNQGVHTVDLLQWLAGDVTQVYAQTRTLAHERIEVEDIAVATLQFAGGAVGTLLATTAAYPGLPVRVDIFGTEGYVSLEGDRLRALQLKNGETYTEETAAAHALAVAQGGSASVRNEAAERTASADPGAVWGDAHRAQIEDFLHAIRTDATPLVNGHEGRKPLEIILGVYRSAQSGLPVPL